jgi:hypothetical protein
MRVVPCTAARRGVVCTAAPCAAHSHSFTRARPLTDTMEGPTKRTISAANRSLDVIRFVDRRARNSEVDWIEFLAQYQLEALLFGTHLKTTGAVYRLLKRSGVGAQALPLKRASVAGGLLSDEEFDELKNLLDADWLRSFTLIPISAVQTAITTF